MLLSLSLSSSLSPGKLTALLLVFVYLCVLRHLHFDQCAFEEAWMTSPICVFVHVEDGELDVGDEKPLLGSLLLDVLHKGVFF